MKNNFLNNQINNNSVIFISFIPIFLWFLIFSLSLINQPYVWDDLHFFRNYTVEELINVWSSNWDPDKIETPSYRPLAVWYYHLLHLIFQENVFLFRLFVILKSFLLLIIINNFLIELNFKKKEIFIFSFLIVFSKIFATLISWFTISIFILIYIFTFLSVIFFLKSLENKSKSFYFVSLIFSFIAIFMREELYILPLMLFFISIIKNEINFKNIFNRFFYITPFLFVVFLHLILRKIFVPEAAHFELEGYILKFGDNPLSLGGVIKVVKSSFLPMGYYSSKYSSLFQTFISLSWVILILISFLILLKDLKGKLVEKKIYIFVILVLVCSIPHITIARSFGIFLPTVFALALVSLLINSFLTKRYFYKIISILIISLGLIGGIYRSSGQIKSMNVFAKDIVYYDMMFVYGYPANGFKISIPQKRFLNKKKHLERLNIFGFEPDLKKIMLKSEKIILTKFDPLMF